MKVAIIGAGFAGLATAYFLLESRSISVTIFDAKKVGGGASSVCSGLLHPYPGLSARRSYKANDALIMSKQLIRVAEIHTPKVVALQRGIVREAQNDEQKNRLMEHCDEWKDVEYLGENRFLIHSGMTVLSENYLEGLWNALATKGAELCIEHIDGLKQLEGFDHIVIAAGWGVRFFAKEINPPIKFLKGQSLRMRGKPPMEKSFISKGYISHMGSEECFEVGGTYEKEFQDDAPDLAKASSLLSDKLEKYCKEAEILKCQAGVRVANSSHYLPIAQKIDETLSIFTGLGSRGLLYHGLYGKALAQSIISNNKVLV